MSEQPEDLVEPEGVNAASADGEPAGPYADVRAGGRPELAPRIPEDVAAPPPEEMAGAPGTAPTDPGQADAPPGQDSGSAR